MSVLPEETCSICQTDARKQLLNTRWLKVRDINVLWEMWDFLSCQSDVTQRRSDGVKQRLHVCDGPVKCFTQRRIMGKPKSNENYILHTV